MIQQGIELEIWKDLDYDGIRKNYYEISNFGRIRRKNDKLILKTFIINSGYEAVHLQTDNGGRINKTVHRLVLTHYGPSPRADQNQVNHIDLNKLNNFYDNLEWNSQKENMDHVKKNNGLRVGEQRKEAKLTNTLVYEICALLQNTNMTYTEILNYIGMEVTDNNRDLIGNIKRKIAWTFISKDFDFSHRN